MVKTTPVPEMMSSCLFFVTAYSPVAALKLPTPDGSPGKPAGLGTNLVRAQVFASGNVRSEITTQPCVLFWVLINDQLLTLSATVHVLINESAPFFFHSLVSRPFVKYSQQENRVICADPLELCMFFMTQCDFQSDAYFVRGFFHVCTSLLPDGPGLITLASQIEQILKFAEYKCCQRICVLLRQRFCNLKHFFNM